MSDDYREDYGSNVRSLETRLRNVEIWKAEQILLARYGKLPGQEHATSPREENGGPVPAINEGQTESPLKESDRPTREQVESQIAGWNPPYSAPAEPAPGSDAEHPPLGYRLAKVAEKREPGYVFWDGEGWIEGGSALFGSPVDRWHSSPCANPITANEGDSRAAESVAIPAGWVECKGHHPSDSRQILHPKTRHIIAWASPNRCVPWGEGYEAILPEEAERGDEYLAGPEWVAPLDPAAWSAEARMAEVWRRKVQPEAESLADRVSDSIADDVQRMQVAIETLTDDRDRALARVAELEAELVVLRKTNRSHHMTITDLNDRLRMVREAAR